MADDVSSWAILRNHVLRNIVLLALVAAILLPLYIYVFIFPAFTRMMVENTEETVAHTANYVATQLLQGLETISPQAIDAAPQLQRQLAETQRDLGLGKLRLFDRDGRIAYSSDAREVGQRNDSPFFREQVAQGQPYSKLKQHGHPTVEGTEALRDVVESYVPIMRNGRFIGAFEFYTDVTEHASLQSQLLSEASLVMLACMVGLIGALTYLLAGAARSLAAQRQADAQIREAAQVFNFSSDASLITDAHGVIRRVNAAFTEITGYNADEAVGKKLSLLKSGRHDATFYAELWRSLHEKGVWEGEIFNQHKDGAIYPQWQTISAVRDANDKLTGFISQYTDVARRKLTEQEVRYRANYDTLTGLPNRELLMERLERSLLDALRRPHQFALLFVDLDHFKQINDALGHQTGDRLLQKVAAYLRSCVRSSDTVARLGGDEFVILLSDLNSPDEAGIVAEKIVAGFASAIDLQPHRVHVSTSIGIAVYPNDGDEIQMLFRNADLAMYRAKESGRNGFHFYEPALTEAVLFRHQLETDLHEALPRGELAMHYQPIIEIATHRLVGVEALMRWQQPTRGIVPPDLFIPVAESIGLIQELGIWALDEVCRQLARWREQGLHLHAAVNVSSRQIPDGLSPALLGGLLDKHGLQPKDLVLEITESILLCDIQAAQQWMDAVRAMGIRIALDDFGTGYSSLSYLQRLHWDVVKIDKSFVQEMGETASSRALVETIIGMGHLFGLGVVAEGVETAEQFSALRDMGCEFAQGYFLSRPLPAAAILQLTQEDVRDGVFMPYDFSGGPPMPCQPAFSD
jgi:diguanylate cyclase (GGDEF)-like protein/PAS domain S-box-containing protein